MSRTPETISTLRDVLASCRTIAVVGLPPHFLCRLDSSVCHSGRHGMAKCLVSNQKCPQNFISAMATKFFIATVLCGIVSVANAQPKVLLEACNAIDDRVKRMECLEEIIRHPTAKHDAKDAQAAALKRAKAAFAAIASTVQSGVSYNNYSVLILEPAKELGVLRQEVPNLDSAALTKLGEAVAAYNDAGTVWRASIFNSQDAGIFFGQILDPNRTGLNAIVNRYRLTTTTVLLSTHLPVEAALSTIWRSAEMSAKNAFEIADGVPQTYTGTKAVCDQWGNPKAFRYTQVRRGHEVSY